MLRIKNKKYRIPGHRSQTPNPESKILNPKSKFPDFKSKINEKFGRNFLWPEKNYGLKNLLAKFFLGQIKFWPNKICVKKNFGRKKCRVKKSVGRKKKFG